MVHTHHIVARLTYLGEIHDWAGSRAGLTVSALACLLLELLALAIGLCSALWPLLKLDVPTGIAYHRACVVVVLRQGILHTSRGRGLTGVCQSHDYTEQINESMCMLL